MTNGITLEQLLAVWKAWNDEGAYPPYHRTMQRKLRNEWPVLAEALDRMGK